MIDCAKQNIRPVLQLKDCWADGRLGDYENSKVALNDSRMIGDLYQKNIISNLLNSNIFLRKKISPIIRPY